jgi:hypothetical protein
VFTKLMSTVGQMAHKRMLYLYLYLDDSLMRNAIRHRYVLILTYCRKMAYAQNVMCAVFTGRAI